MLDTNVFNRLLDGEFHLSDLGPGTWIATGIQRAELAATTNECRRNRLLAQMDVVAPDVMPTASFAFDYDGAGFDQARWNDRRGRFEQMLDRLKVLDKLAGKRPAHENQVRDVLIAETAIVEGAILATADRSLDILMGEFGGRSALVSR